ncbi:hypothetical protein QJS10_CPB14g00021 [Acorus calamus]|uniref:Putative rRNA methyltransferase n=1 Tax=Acorus calamus TaxID=4465 RepID=A0AAV9DDM5_ACOCL|nr:hypothetical protein QJS10_CPB14g00021 [Acorus calamus]
MGKKAKGKERLDKYYRLAKEVGYRSRAAYKLVQLDASFKFLSSADSVLDLCAAPGGWMQVAAQKTAVTSLVLGVDLFPIRPVHRAISIVENITTPKCRSSIKRIMSENGRSVFDVVLHDGSPNVGGAWAQEATAQAALVIDAVRLATEFLCPRGTFVTKVFRSQDYTAVIYCLKQLFEKVEVTKPQASRSASAEIYVVGLKYKAPAKIDPRLLDVKHLFSGAVTTAPKVVDVLKGTKQKRNREGYEDGNTTLRKVGLASDFIWTETPLEFLGSVTSISFDDPPSASVKDHKLTTEEIKALCDDLALLNPHEFRNLLKWRMHIRKALSSTEKVTKKTTDTEDETEIDEDENLLNEMEALTSAMERKKKRAKKLLAKRRTKDKSRKGMQIDATEDSYHDHELFSLSLIKGKKELSAVDSPDFDDDEGLINSENEGGPVAADQEDSPSDVDTDEESRRYDEKLEEVLDQAYERYVSRKGGKTTQRKRAKRLLSENLEPLEGGDDEGMTNLDYDSDKDEKDQEGNPLMVPLNEPDRPTQDQVMETWFSQDIFAEAAEEGAFGEEESEDDEEKVKGKKQLNQKKPEKIRAQVEDTSIVKALVTPEDDFEVVPAKAVDSSSDDSSSSDESEEDDDTKAEVLAYAKKMLRKKQREQILDDAYNRYMFDDEGLPTWFVEEEKRHSQPMKPITKEEVAAMKAQFKEIDTRPAKKVAEAKARKKRVAMRKLETARKKANSISDQTEISDKSKSRMINQLYKKAMSTKKPKKEYVVAKKGVAVRGGKGKVVVDRRMKKDARSHGTGKKGKGGMKKGKGSAKGNAKGTRGKGSAKASARKGPKGNRG